MAASAATHESVQHLRCCLQLLLAAAAASKQRLAECSSKQQQQQCQTLATSPPRDFEKEYCFSVSKLWEGGGFGEKVCVSRSGAAVDSPLSQIIRCPWMCHMSNAVLLLFVCLLLWGVVLSSRWLLFFLCHRPS